MSDHIQSKLIHLRWQIGTYQSHIKYIQGQIRLIHRLIHLVIVLLNFCFQKCRDPNPRLDPVGRSKSEPGLLRHFQLSSQNIFVWFYSIFVFKSVATRIPDSTRLADPRRSPVYSGIFNYLLKTFCWVLFHFRLFNYTEALQFGQAHKHLQNNAFISTYTHAIHFHMLSFYKSFIISQHTFSMQ